MPNIYADAAMTDAPPINTFTTKYGRDTPPATPQHSTLTLPVAHGGANQSSLRASSAHLEDSHLGVPTLPDQLVRSKSAPAAEGSPQKGRDGYAQDGSSNGFQATDGVSGSSSSYDKVSPSEIEERRRNAPPICQRAMRMQKALPTAALRTGLCYDVRMRYHATVDKGELHPEDPRRIHVIYQALAEAGLIVNEEKEPNYKEDAEAELMLRIKAREVSRDEALLVHGPEHWDFIESTQHMDEGALQAESDAGDSVYYNNESFFCAKLSCGGAIETCRAVWTGQVKNAVAVIRPPGHHAEPHMCMGFCLLNNVAVAASVIQDEYPECSKILILDWDVHHGNGTQKAFYNNKKVLYMSIHRYGNAEFYPPTPAGNWDHVGEGDAVGMNVNVPWETGGMCDADYLYAFQRCLMPIAYEYNPDLVIISAGFDAAAGDSIGGCYVTPAGYAHMTHMLMSLAGGKVVVVLEGGYNLTSISHSCLAVTKTLMGDPPGPLHSIYASNKAIAVVQEVILEHSQYWRCLDYKAIKESVNMENIQSERLHDVIRKHQAKDLGDSHGMMNLCILRPKVSPSFQDQVLATPNYAEAEVLVFIVHDAPQVVAQPKSATNTIALHNSFLLDTGKPYIDWAIKKGYAVIDLNVPSFITPEDEQSANEAPATGAKAVEMLSLYIWDNYIDLSDAKKVVFIGVGEAYCGLVHILSLRNCTTRVVATVSFLADHNLRAVNPTRDENIGSWYYKNSRVYVAHNHSVWTNIKRAKSKFGCLEKVPHEAISNIQSDSFAAATAFIQQQLSPGERLKAPQPNFGGGY